MTKAASGGRAIQRAVTRVKPVQHPRCHSHINVHTALRNSSGGPSGQLLGCGLDMTVEEIDLRSQHVGEACSAFVDVVVAAGAAEKITAVNGLRR